MPQIAMGTSLEVIAYKLKIDADTKGAESQVGYTLTGREVRHDGKEARIKSGSKWISRDTSRETHRQGGRELVLTGLRASLQQLLPFGQQVDVQVVSIAQKFLGLPDIGQKGKWATDGQVRAGVLYARQLGQLRQAAPGLTLAQGQALLEVSGWPSADAERLKLAAKRMVANPISAEEAWRLSDLVEADFGSIPPAPAAVSPSAAQLSEEVEVALRSVQLASDRAAALRTYAIDKGITDAATVRGIGHYMKTTKQSVEHAAGMWSVKQAVDQSAS